MNRCTVAVILSFLAFPSNGRRFRTSVEKSRESSVKVCDTFQKLEALATLLMVPENPTTGWQVIARSPSLQRQVMAKRAHQRAPSHVELNHVSDEEESDRIMKGHFVSRRAALASGLFAVLASASASHAEDAAPTAAPTEAPKEVAKEAPKKEAPKPKKPVSAYSQMATKAKKERARADPSKGAPVITNKQGKEQLAANAELQAIVQSVNKGDYGGRRPGAPLTDDELVVGKNFGVARTKMVRYRGENDLYPVTRNLTRQQIEQLEKVSGQKVVCPKWGGACSLVAPES